jgi:hypothetical protein
VEELGRIVVTVSQHTVFLAEAAISNCGMCSKAPGVPFSRILERVGNHPSGSADFILPVLGHCPFCQALLNEQTLVVPKPQRRR